MTVITPQQIRDAALKVYRAIGPDHSYVDVVPGWSPLRGQCQYVVDNYASGMPSRVPGCIVGRILFEAGVPIQEMDEMDNVGAMAFMQELHRDGWWGETAENVDVAHSLQRAQAEQDHAAPWQAALQSSGLVTTEMLKENV